ncbi:MAG: glycosyltransferase family 39 protein [Acidobacteria bacterium]|nr:glycosyltransferase family 39 protein [Acidobacteriota bacterium]
MVCFAASLVFLLLTHLAFLKLPYHWDELGQFIPAAHDLLVSGALVPQSTLPNIHPPLLMAYLAVAWKIFGFSVPVTRVAMLVLGAATITAAFLLARKLAGAGAAWAAAVLLAVSPPFVAQSMLAHLDLAAAFWVLLALYWFLEDRWWLCAAAATALVLTKETGIIVPVVLFLFARRERKSLAVLLLPCAALAAWLILLRSTTGYWGGNPEFERYNLGHALNPVRILAVLLRRVYQLGLSNFHWAATALIVWAWRTGRAFQDPRWRVPATVVAAYLGLHSVVGGAVLLRYLLPALALFYTAAAAALDSLRPRLRAAFFAVMLAGLAVSNWWNPPYPFGYEDNLAVTDFIRLQQQAAAWLSQHYPDRTITTAWPLTGALSNPLCGYVTRPLRVNPIEDFQLGAWSSLDPSRVDLLVLYSRSWEPEWGWQNWPPVAHLLERHFGYRPQVAREKWIEKFHLRRLARWERRGQWVEIFITVAPGP